MSFRFKFLKRLSLLACVFSASICFSQKAIPSHDDIRIMTLAPHLTEIVAAIGATDQLVGVSAYSNYPAEVKNIPIIGDMRTLDLEKIQKLRPTIILLWKTGTPETSRVALHKIFSKTSTQLIESDAHSLTEIASEIERLGIILNHTEKAQAVAQKMRDSINKLSQENSHKAPIRVFFQVWSNPLMTVNQKHFIGDMIHICGGELLFAKATLLTPVVSRESVVLENPEVILSSADRERSSNPDMDAWKKFSKLDVNRLDGYLQVNGDWLTRGTPRTLLATQQICDFLDVIRARKVRLLQP